MKLKNLKIGLGITGSFCNFSKLDKIIDNIHKEEVKDILPIVSYSVLKTDSRFGKAKDNINRIEKLTNNKVIDSIEKVEPIGPKDMIDILIIAPCTGNTLAKFVNGITDTPVLMAAKSHIRNNKPLLIAISTNDGLGTNAINIGKAINMKNIYIVPFNQDDPIKKPKSLVFDVNQIIKSCELALDGIQIEPVIL